MIRIAFFLVVGAVLVVAPLLLAQLAHWVAEMDLDEERERREVSR